MEKLALPTILLIALFLLCPPLFSEGGIFDISAIDENGTLVHGIYFDNVYNVILYLFLSWLSIVIPFYSKSIKPQYKYLSLLAGGWLVAGSAFELANFAEPLKIYNTPDNRGNFTYCLFVFTIGITLIIINSKWNKSVQQSL